MNPDLLTRYGIDYTLAIRASTIGLWRLRGALSDSSSSGAVLTGVGIVMTDYGLGISEAGVTAVTLDGSKKATRSAAQATAFDMGTDNFSLEAIVKVESGNVGSFIQKSDGATPNTGYILGTGLHKLTVKLGDGANQTYTLSATTIDDGAWHYVALVVDRDSDQARFYIDGIEDANSPVDISSIAGNIGNNAVDLEVGTSLAGSIDEVCVSKEILTALAIAERAAGRDLLEHVFEPDFLLKFLPGIHHGNNDLREFLGPFDAVYQRLQAYSNGITDLVKWDQCPVRFLPQLASNLSFELIDAPFATEAQRRHFLESITWIYKRRGLLVAINKFFELLGFTCNITEEYPDWVPFVLELHRTWDKNSISQIHFDEDFSGSLSQWDAPLGTGSYWRLSSGCLVGTGDGTDSIANGILFDDNNEDYYFEVDYELIDDAGFDGCGLILKYVDSDNYLLVTAEWTGPAYMLYFQWKVGGVANNQMIAPIIPVNAAPLTGVHQLRCFINHTTNRFSFGLDDETFAHDVTGPTATTGLSVGKKGLWVSYGITVGFDNVRIQTVNRTLAPVLHPGIEVDRTLWIELTNSPAYAAEKQEYLARVLPRYLPFGVNLGWIAKPGSVGAGLGTGSIVSASGYILSGARAAGMGAGTGGITSVLGSVTSILSGAAATGMGAGTRMAGASCLPGSSGMGAGTGGLATKILNNPYGSYGVTDPNIRAMHHYPVPALSDGDYDTGTQNYTQVGCSYGNLTTVKTIRLFDSQSIEPDGLYTGTHNKIKVYSAISWPGCYNYTLEETFASVTRTGQLIALVLATPVDCKWIFLHFYDGALWSPGGQYIYFTELETEDV